MDREFICLCLQTSWNNDWGGLPSRLIHLDNRPNVHLEERVTKGSLDTIGSRTSSEAKG